MKIVIHPAVEPDRLDALKAAAPGAEWVNAADPAEAVAAIAGADAFIGKITPGVLAKADQLRWVQSFTASLEHYMFPELVRAPVHARRNMRGLFGDVIADQVMGYILCFARNLHTYIRRQVEHRYEPLGGESARVSNATGPGVRQRHGPGHDLPARGDAGRDRPGRRSARRSRDGRWPSG